MHDEEYQPIMLSTGRTIVPKRISPTKVEMSLEDGSEMSGAEWDEYVRLFLEARSKLLKKRRKS